MSETVKPVKPKAQKLIIDVIEEIVYSGRQSREYKFTAKLAKGKESFKIQIHIDRDSYDFQSSAIAYVWKPTELAWSRVASIPYNEMKTGDKYTLQSKYHFAEDKNRLMGLLEQILF